MAAMDIPFLIYSRSHFSRDLRAAAILRVAILRAAILLSKVLMATKDREARAGMVDEYKNANQRYVLQFLC